MPSLGTDSATVIVARDFSMWINNMNSQNAEEFINDDEGVEFCG